MPKPVHDVLSPDHWRYEREARRRTLAWASLQGQARIEAIRALAEAARANGMEFCARSYDAKIRELEARLNDV